MVDGDVTTRSKNGQWLNHVEGHPESSQSFSSREDAVIVGEKDAEITEHPRTTDENGMPLENPSG